VLNNIYNLNCDEYDIHISIPGGMPVDGPSAGIAIAVAIYSAITKLPINNKVAMTGEISILGAVKPVGGVVAKIIAASKAGADTVIIPMDNYCEGLLKEENINIVPATNIREVIEKTILKTRESVDILSAKRL
jgi:Lon-like ATP-dependent protease